MNKHTDRKDRKDRKFSQVTLRKVRLTASLMRGIYVVAGISMITLISACSLPERSRSLDNPAISATTIAQQVCSNCHGVDGISVSPNFPNLAAQSNTYLKDQLKSYKSHGRSDPAGFEYMWGLSARLTDEQITGLADYYSSKKPTSGKANDSELVKKGKTIFEVGIESSNTPACTSCHGAKGEGMLQFPRLAGQHADYVEKQLVVFQRTDQRPEGAVMKVIAHGLTTDNINSIGAYLESISSKD